MRKCVKWSEKIWRVRAFLKMKKRRGWYEQRQSTIYWNIKKRQGHDDFALFDLVIKFWLTFSKFILPKELFSNLKNPVSAIFIYWRFCYYVACSIISWIGAAFISVSRSLSFLSPLAVDAIMEWALHGLMPSKEVREKPICGRGGKISSGKEGI